MSPKILITGGTGYIGGSVLHTLSTHLPGAQITALLRSPPADFSSTYPHITVAQGDYDNTALLTQLASASDIIIHNGNSDHVASLTALIAGLRQKHAQTAAKGFLLHLSGTGIVADWADATYAGRLSPQVWTDLDVEAIRNVSETALHAATERVLHAAVREHGAELNVAIVCPPDIYGRGLGPGKKSSALVPLFVAEVKGRGRAFCVGEGANARGWVHVSDLMRLYMHIVDAAVAGDEKAFNENGYYFAATSEHSQIELARGVGEVLCAKGVIGSADVEAISLDEVDGVANVFPGFPKLGRYLFASNARTRAERAAREFGYRGEAPGLMEVLEMDVADALGEV